MTNIVEEVLPEERTRGLISRDDNKVDYFCNIYERINSSNDEIKKQYNQNLLINFSDLKELHEKTSQTINSLKPISAGVKIYIYQNGGESEKFKSFEEFEGFKITSPNATNNIYFVYNFTTQDSETGDFELYKIKIRVISRVSMISEFEKEAPPFMSPSILASVATPIVIIEIEYSDYIKARNFISMIDEWVLGCDETNSSKLLNKFKAYSHFIPKIGKNLIYLLLGYFTLFSINDESFTNLQSVKFFIFYITAFVILGSTASSLLSKVEKSIDSYMSMSYINMNKGDAKLIKKYKSRNTSSVIYSILGFVGTLSIGLLTNVIYDLVKVFIA
ncbi:hypothetical protein PVK62_07615 [Aliivibrio sp. S3MY1]|uniref:hypothetical protein n=1 Tax=unclassified Aliivibrio TaxID=2645654 RepID=UPI002377F8D2|nr:MULTISPECIES: hypothetical protein [unclassified Aliivibrio]MDD9195705.1 hypothetical protein [Aliivibrio sp. S3MY1]MDD9199128.1 hypothetical protein [Aliivibrio sp. S2MY1]